MKLFDDRKSYEEIESFLKKNDENASLRVENVNDESTNFYLSSKINIQTPGLNLILDNPYTVEVKRVVYNGS